MVSELAGEGALPSQLPTPARRLLEISELRNGLRQPIRRGSLVCRDYSDPQTLSYSYSALRLSDQLSDYEIDRIDEKDRNLSRVLFKSSCLRSRSVKYSSAVLVNPSSAAIIVPGADRWRARAQSLLVLDRWHRNNSRSIFVEISSRVLVNPMSSVFDRRSRSRSVESTSIALVSQPNTVDSVCVGRSPAITIRNSTLLEEMQLVKKSKKNKLAGGSVARELDERRRSLFDVIPKLMNGVTELYRDPERHQQSRRECAAVIEACAEYAQIISTGNQYIFNMQSKYSSAESSDCKIFAKLFEEFLDNLIDVVVLLPVSKIGASEIHFLKFQVLVEKMVSFESLDVKKIGVVLDVPAVDIPLCDVFDIGLGIEVDLDVLSVGLPVGVEGLDLPAVEVQEIMDILVYYLHGGKVVFNDIFQIDMLLYYLLCLVSLELMVQTVLVLYSFSTDLNLEQSFSIHVGVAYTRWATHGETTPSNSHPQISGVGNDFLVVHNGVIINNEALKDTLIRLALLNQKQIQRHLSRVKTSISTLQVAATSMEQTLVADMRELTRLELIRTSHLADHEEPVDASDGSGFASVH
nr:glutamine--fructose-6-phosphate aminotransferase [isomerizing] 2 [Ipomoea batatas]